MAGQGRHGADEALALALARGETVANAATQSGVSPRTAARRTADPDFKTRVQKLRTELFQSAASHLVASMGEAARALQGLLASQDERVRLQAARSVIEHGMKIVEVAELERRVCELEGRADAAAKSEEKGRGAR